MATLKIDTTQMSLASLNSKQYCLSKTGVSYLLCCVSIDTKKKKEKLLTLHSLSAIRLNSTCISDRLEEVQKVLYNKGKYTDSYLF